MGPDFLPPTCRLCCGQEGPTWTHCFDLSWLESTARDGDRSRPHRSSRGLGKQLADFAPAVAALRSLMALKTILAPEGADRPCFPLKWAPSRGQDSRAGLCSCLGGGRPLVPAAPPSTVTGTCTRSSAWSLQPDAAGSVDRRRSQGRVISRRLQPSVSGGGRGKRSQGFSVSWAAG